MADQEKIPHGKSQRHRRDPKRKREQIYCYDVVDDKVQDKEEPEEQEVIREEDDDDSFTYGLAKGRKNEFKKKKQKIKQIEKKGKNNSDNDDSEQKMGINSRSRKNVVIDERDSHGKKNKNQKRKKEVESNQQCYVEYFTSKAKQPQELKIFNPQLYNSNILQKNQYEKQLQELYQQFGKRVEKYEEPEVKGISWKYLMAQVEEAGKDFAAERQERIKLKRKISKFSQSTWNRMEQINQQKIKDQERKIRKQSLELIKHVKRQFWGSCIKVRKVINQQECKKYEKEEQMKKLEELVARQFEASQKITQILEGYEEVSLANVTVSQATSIPVVIDLVKKQQEGDIKSYEYMGLHEDNMIRPSLLIKFPLREYQLLGVYWISTLHDKGMNAILADEMGLGKTIQTIAFLAHLALQKGIWGPHLVVVPTTILMNWQIQFKRWCPAFKIMTYFGSPRERKVKRKGWSKLNSFHVCITSYKIAVTDNPIFRRKKWYYMILDQAQNIKNFKSQRWQVLLNFKTKNRLLLTGTPLQNDLTQLWSLLHFLMPRVFNSFEDFNEWFNIPFQQALEKNFPISQQILKKLHTILRPFFLRRLKKDVEKQLPTKSQRIIRCSMSRRQKYLYDEMIWHENKKQRNHQSSGGMMNVLMGLKKICNHPDLFQPRIEQSPLNWVPLTVVIAHHMFLKSHFQTYKTHILKDFVDNFTTTFEQIAQDILKDYDSGMLNEDNSIYFKNKFRDRLFFARINYERSKRKQFRLYGFDFQKFQMVKQKVPYYMCKGILERALEFETVFDKFLFVVPRVMARPARLATFPMSSEVQSESNLLEYLRHKVRVVIPRQLQCIRSRFLLHFPSKTIILYDSGKLIKLVFLLRSIKYRGQKALIFTQMTKMLDIFEKILNMFKFNYVRLDGSTKTEVRQTLVQKFNNDPRVLCFISSTRSGGIGLNLTGASNVIFYETDWNPAMDRQAQDRCHRIGQTRNVIIYRLITQHSIQQNILMKSIQKRRLEELVTQEGMFNTSYFEKVNIKDMLAGAIDYNDDEEGNLAQVEDQQDREMLHMAERENKQKKQDLQQELQVEMLPKLFRYGLNMLQNQQIMQQINTQLSQEQANQQIVSQSLSNQQEVKQQQQQDEQELQQQGDNEQKQRNKKSLRNFKQQNKQQQNNDDKIYEQPQQQQKQEQEILLSEQQNLQHRPAFLSTEERLKAMAIYQAQYQFMKQHYFYSDNLPMENIHQDDYENKQTISTKKKSQKKKKKKRK